MAQSYVGKRTISKGIGGAIRKFVVFGFRGPRGEAEIAYPV
jgi:hypothetical protein